jgi:hypothetical protein
MPVNHGSHQFPIVPELPSQNQFPAVPYYVGGTSQIAVYGQQSALLLTG